MFGRCAREGLSDARIAVRVWPVLLHAGAGRPAKADDLLIDTYGEWVSPICRATHCKPWRRCKICNITVRMFCTDNTGRAITAHCFRGGENCCDEMAHPEADFKDI